MYTFCCYLFGNFFTTWIAILAIEVLIISDVAEFILARRCTDFLVNNELLEKLG